MHGLDRHVLFFDYPSVGGEFQMVSDSLGTLGTFVSSATSKGLRNTSRIIIRQSSIGATRLNAADSLQLGLVSGGRELGADDIFSTHTMVAPPASLKFAGGVPTPVDILGDHLIGLQR